MKRLLTVAFLIAMSCNLAFSQQPREKPKELDALRQYVGDWNTEVTSKRAEWTPQEIKYRCKNHAELILDGWFLQNREVNHVVGEPDQMTKAIWFQTFDMNSKKYVTWSFQSSGLIARSVGTWDDVGQTFVLRDVEPPPGTTNRFEERFRNTGEIDGSLTFTGNGGRKMFDMVWVRKKQAGLAGKPLAEQWSAIGTPIQPIPPEVKRLAAFVGQWDAEFNTRPTDANPNGATRKGTMSGRWILDGRWLLGESDVENVQAKWVIGYDTNKQAFRYVCFTSLGQVEENIGQWNEADKSFTWKGVGGPPGLTRTSTSRLIDNGVIETHILTKSQDGKVQMDLTIKSTPRK